MSLRNKWVELIYRITTGRAWKRGVLTPVGVTVFFLIMSLYVLAAIYVDRIVRFPTLIYRPWNEIGGGILILVGIFLTLWSATIFFKARGTPVPFNPPPQLVTSGPYAYVRNPMITGVFLQLLGAGLFLSLFSLVFIFTPLFIVMNIAYLKQIEEPELERRLGNAYHKYREKVPMFFPRFSAYKEKPK